MFNASKSEYPGPSSYPPPPPQMKWNGMEWNEMKPDTNKQKGANFGFSSGRS